MNQSTDSTGGSIECGPEGGMKTFKLLLTLNFPRDKNSAPKNNRDLDFV